ncbi:MAG: YqgE/AlgH family protein [Thiohalospira sp.]
MTQDSPNLTHQFLIAMPGLEDPNFARTVTYVCQHDAEGAMGVVINRPTRVTLDAVLEQMEMETQEAEVATLPVYSGGPVNTERGFILHRPTGQWEASLPVGDDIALTSSRDILEAIALGAGPKERIMVLGYAGWQPGQLEQEMADNAWLSGPASAEVIFNTPPDERWQAAARALGVDLALLSSEAGHA